MNISWLLFKKSGKKSSRRLILTTFAVALGVLMLLLFAAGINALTLRTTYGNWRTDVYDITKMGKKISGVSPLKISAGYSGNINKWQNKDIDITSVSATGENSPTLLNLKTPKNGEYYVSRGLAEVIKKNPSYDIGSRFGTKQIGIIPDKLSVSPDSLEVIRGMSATEANMPSVTEIYKFYVSTETSMYSGILGVVLIFGATILLFPIVMFVSIATQLGSAQREKRYAAMRLIGATRAQISRIMAFESFIAAVAGVIIGSFAYLLIKIPLSEFRFDDMRFWQNDISVPFGSYVLIVFATLLMCVVANWWGMRHVQTSPLGVTRSQKLSKKPHFWSMIPLIIGIGIFALLSTEFGKKLFLDNPDSMLSTYVLLGGILLVMFGLVWAGSWLTSKMANIFSKHTQDASTLIATKRISGYSKQVFRSVSGVVLALFAGSFYLTAVSGIDKLNTQAIANNGYSQMDSGTALVINPNLPSDFDKTLNLQKYVESAAVIAQTENGYIMTCDVMQKYTNRQCPLNSNSDDYIRINFDAPISTELSVIDEMPTIESNVFLVKLDDNKSLDKLRNLVIDGIGVVSTDLTYVISGTFAKIAIISPIIKELSGLAYVGMAITLFVAIASLIVSTVGGLIERQRSFMTLRLGGMAISQMKKIVMIESLIPLIIVSIFAAGVGVWVGAVFITATSSSLKPVLSLLYFAIVIGSLLFAVFCIYLILPMLKRITSLEENRTE